MILVRCRQTFFVCSAFFLLLSAAVSVKGQATGLKLDYPNGNEIFYTTRDTSIVIRWSGVDDTTKVNLDISSDAGLSWNLLKDSLTGSSYEWNIRGAAISSTYRIRVAQVRPPAPRDDIQYTGHVGPVYDAVWSPSGRRVASISAQVHVWDAGTGGTLEATILPGPRTVYNGLNWSADSLRIVAGGEDQVARVYDATTNALVQGLNIPGVINECFFNPQSTEILVASDDLRARVFVMPSALSLAPYIATGQIEHVAWSPNGLRVLVCASQARVQNRAGGAPLQFTRHGVSVDDGAWSPDGKFICSVGGDASIRMWDAQTAVERWSILNVPDGVRCVTFSADGSMVAVGGGDSSLVVYNAVDGSVLHAINSHALAVRMVAFSKDGTEWTPTKKVLAEGDWLWRVTWHDGVCYGVSYNAAERTSKQAKEAAATGKADPGPAEWKLKLWSSKDGETFDLVSHLDVPGHPNETTVRLADNGEMVALVRREGGDKNGWVGTSQSPVLRAAHADAEQQ